MAVGGPSTDPPMLTGSIEHTPHAPTPYRVVLKQDGVMVRAQPVADMAEAKLRLVQLLKEGRHPPGPTYLID
jgi:hypothetical protein